MGTSNRISIDLTGHTAQPTHPAALVTGGEEQVKKAAGEAWSSSRRKGHLADYLATYWRDESRCKAQIGD
jgi:hypothetical protein